MRFFLDTEFNEDGKTIELISIALVSEDGREWEWVSSEFDEAKCNDWVKQNVLPHLPPPAKRFPRYIIARVLAEIVLLDSGPNPEFWGYFADYDWVVLCQLYGAMVSLPKGFPHLCYDLKQLMKFMGYTKEELPKQPEGTLHSALADARWNRDAYNFMHGMGGPLDEFQVRVQIRRCEERLRAAQGLERRIVEAVKARCTHADAEGNDLRVGVPVSGERWCAACKRTFD